MQVFFSSQWTKSEGGTFILFCKFLLWCNFSMITCQECPQVLQKKKKIQLRTFILRMNVLFFFPPQSFFLCKCCIIDSYQAHSDLDTQVSHLQVLVSAYTWVSKHSVASTDSTAVSPIPFSLTLWLCLHLKTDFNVRKYDDTALCFFFK